MMQVRFTASAAVVCGLAALGGTVRGDVFHLHNGGRIAGTLVESRAEGVELLLPSERPWRIKTAVGAVVVLPREAVAEHVRVRPALDEYERVRPTYPDTAQGQWALAEWCRERDFVTLRKKHLERVVELDPEHDAARRGLGHCRLDGKWAHPRDVMHARGYVEHRGRWRLPQEVELIEARAARIEAECDWRRKIEVWRDWVLMGGPRSWEAQEKLKQLDDPNALRVLHYLLIYERRFAARVVYCEALVRTGGPGAQAVLVERAVHDPHPEIRRTCAQAVARAKTPDAAAYYVKMLRHRNDAVVGAAATAAGFLKDPATVGPLIDALVVLRSKYLPVERTVTTVQENRGFVYGAAGPTSFGGKVRTDAKYKWMTVPFENPFVLEALAAITGENYGFDQPAWRAWYAGLKRAEAAALDARRD